jgi:O-antigen ligase
VAAAVFIMANYKYTLKYFLLAALSSPLWVSLLPSNVTSRFASIGNIADSSTYYRLYTWKGTLRMLSEHYLGGIGVGESAFAHIYPLYAYVGTEVTAHSHNLFLQITVELGVAGLVLLLIAAFMIAQRGFGCIKLNSENKGVVCAVSAAIAGITGALVHGVVDHIWYNYRVFFMFWVVAAVICAYANVYPKKMRVEALNQKESDQNKASLDVIFGNKNNA